MPYGRTEFNKHSFPMKTLEYLSAGRPVVATSLPAIRWLDTDLVPLADTPEAFARGRPRGGPARDAALVLRRRAVRRGPQLGAARRALRGAPRAPRIAHAPAQGFPGHSTGSR